ncbi:DUF2442 domain-containing protein [Longimicrobium sp.]|uniref:DUF2442 domain-containing protein n=1 Tax=Longimicrobium sp. TaxID=2029185 RepID=UPI002C20A09A|nr:DUF2442 domain-containing protein [Longimicrobium sp.]HSU17817.1 DUF2442 domain-containing protein [Longimicrobium sp.]
MGWHLTDEEILAQYEEATARGEHEDRVEPRAVKAWYDAERKLVMFELKNGCVFGFPQHFGQGIEEASPEQLAEVDPAFWHGEALRWEELNADISVPGLLYYLLNVKEWYAKWLGSAKSEAKAAAARENGKKGGRPRKSTAAERPARRKTARSGD